MSQTVIFFNCILSLFSFQMLPTFPVSPYPILPPPDSMRVFLHPPIHSNLTVLDFPILGHLSSLHRTKDLSFHWCLTRPSSATYAALAKCTPQDSRESNNPINRAKQRILNWGILNGLEVPKEKFSILSHQENASHTERSQEELLTQASGLYRTS